MDPLLWIGAVAWVPLHQIIRALIGSLRAAMCGEAAARYQYFKIKLVNDSTLKQRNKINFKIQTRILELCSLVQLLQ